jgi:hypothetical protein
LNVEEKTTNHFHCKIAKNDIINEGKEPATICVAMGAILTWAIHAQRNAIDQNDNHLQMGE